MSTQPPLSFVANPFRYARRVSREVKVGKVSVGGANPIRVQSMLTCDTMDTAACIQQSPFKPTQVSWRPPF